MTRTEEGRKVGEDGKRGEKRRKEGEGEEGERRTTQNVRSR